MKDNKTLNINPLEFLDEGEIEYKGPNSRGWITLSECPFCSGHNKAYLLVEKDSQLELPVGFFNCYSCNVKGGFEVFFAAIMGIERKEAFKKCFTYKKNTKKSMSFDFKTQEIDQGPQSTFDFAKTLKEISMPPGAVPLALDNIEKFPAAVDYLESRNLTRSEIFKMKIWVCPKSSLKDSLKTEMALKNTNFKEHEIWAAIKNKSSIQDDSLNQIVGDIFKRANFSQRVIIPSYVGKKLLGFIARAYAKDFSGPKVLNSSGAFTSVSITNFNNIIKSDQIVFVEGVFDAVATGLNRSVPILGKEISSAQPRFKLLDLLPAQEAVFFPDPGARSSINVVAESLLKRFKSVRIVISPNELKMPVFKEDMELFNLMGGEIHNAKFYLSPYSLQSLKRISKAVIHNKRTDKDTAINFLKKRYSTASKPEKDNLESLLKAISLDQLKSILSGKHQRLLTNDFKDASDLGKAICEDLIANAQEYSSLVGNYGRYDDISYLRAEK